MSSGKDLINFCACDYCHKDIRECDASCPRFSYNAHAVDIMLKQAETIKKLREALEFLCGDRCAHQNPCYAKDILEETKD